MSEGQEEYYVGVFHHLEAARQLNRDELAAALLKSKPVALRDVIWARVLDYQYSLAPLSLLGSLMQGGRFNIGNDLDPAKFPAFPALYVAEDYATAYAEKFGEIIQQPGAFQGHELALRNPSSFSHIRLQPDVATLFDLTEPKNLDAFVRVIKSFELPRELKDLAVELGIRPPWLITTPRKLYADLLSVNWRLWPTQFGVPANCQIFGRSLVEAGFEGVLYPSAKGRGKCAAIFPQCFNNSGSSVRLADEVPAGVTSTVLDENTYQALAL